MEFVLVEAYAEGGYTGLTYEEYVLLPKEVYDNVKEQIEQIKIYVRDLDGKHSETKADFYIEVFEDVDKIQNKNWSKEICSDYDELHYRINKILEPLGLNSLTEKNKVIKYIKSLDCLTDITVTVRNSQVPKVMDFIKSLRGNKYENIL